MLGKRYKSNDSTFEIRRFTINHCHVEKKKKLYAYTQRYIFLAVPNPEKNGKKISK